MARFWTSDTHFSHNNIIQYTDRPWATPEDMNKGLIDRWNAVVGDSDDVIVLGDFAMGKISESLPVAERLNGNKFLVPGNHDRVWQGNKDPEKWVQKYEDVGFKIMPSQTLASIGSHLVKVCHFPYEMHDSRYENFHPKDEDDIILHGHVHSSWRVRGKQINVGVDVWGYAPVPDSWIIPILDRIAS